PPQGDAPLRHPADRFAAHRPLSPAAGKRRTCRERHLGVRFFRPAQRRTGPPRPQGTGLRPGGRTMKVVILAGGYGTRISEESTIRTKPMVEIGGRPTLWHIMTIYSTHGLTDFVISCSYRGEIIKRFFRAYSPARLDVTF